MPLRQAAAIQFKNLVMRNWDPEASEADDAAARGRVASADGTQPPGAGGLPAADKAFVRANLLAAMIACPPLLRSQLSVAVRVAAEADYPERWPELGAALVAELHAADPARLGGALSTLRVLTRTFEYQPETEKRRVLHALVGDAFPPLLRCVQGLLAQPGRSLEVAELVKLSLKVFWSATYLDVPPLLHEPPAFHEWMTVLAGVVEMPLPLEAQPADLDERMQWPWWKAKKWALHTCNRLFSRYSNPKAASGPQHRAFAARFKQAYVVPIVEAYLRVLAGLAGGAYLPPRCVHYAVQLLQYAVPKAAAYRLLAPALPDLLLRCIFPLLCFSEEDAELWELDPHEYIRKGYDIIEDMYSPRTAAMTFITQLLRIRTEQLPGFVAFLVAVLQRSAQGAAEGGASARELDGALYSLGALSDLLKRTAPYNAHLEAMLVGTVLPQFASQHGHLRAKAVWLAGQYADINFTDPAHFRALMERVLAALNDAELPVRVDAVVSLRSFIEEADEATLTSLHALLPPLLSRFFELMAEVEHEELVFTLEAIVDRFGDAIVPYATGLIVNLVAAFWRAIKNGDDGDDDDDDSGALACLGCLRAMGTILDAVSEQRALYAQLEPHLMPVLRRMLGSEDGLDVYEEVLYLLNYLTYFGPAISAELWSLFPVLLHNINEFALDSFADSLVSLDNYISRDPDVFMAGADARGVPHPDAVLALCASVLANPEYEDDDCVPAPQLLSLVLVHCRGRADRLLSPALQLAASRLGGPRAARAPFFVDTLLLLWAHCLIYDAAAALAAAAAAGALGTLLGAWTAALGARRRNGKRTHFRREQDKKVCALALTAALLLPPAAAPEAVRGAGPALAAAALGLLSELKAQRLERIEEQAAEQNGGDDGDDGDDDDSDGGGFASGAALLEEENDAVDDAGGDDSVHVAPAAWGGQRRSRLTGGDGDDGSEDSWSDFTEEEDEATSPLDDVDPWISLVDGLTGLAHTDAARFQALRVSLPPEALQMLEEVGAFAQQRRQEIATESAKALAGVQPA
jgi:hypothetical protein